LLARAAKGGVDAMIPDTIETFAKIGDDEWQKSAVIDLRNFDGKISGKVTPSTGVLYVRGDYYTEFGSKPVITGEDSDVICGKAMICNVIQEVDEISGHYWYSYPVGFTPDTGNIDGLDIKFIPN
ncbi:hypothetical protein KC960_04730, partial [Candidatus Saccharibacteria bacterium]|nr:hypothetical protein [Candidatus Saccharibacteria bacterium]